MSQPESERAKWSSRRARRDSTQIQPVFAIPEAVRLMGPPVFYEAIDEVVRNTQAPIDMVGFCALAAISVATQQLIKVRLPSMGEKATSLMLMVIAKSGERKSTVEAKLFNAIREFEAEQRTAYDKAHPDWKVKHKIWQTEHKAINKLLEKAISKNQTPNDIDAIKTRLTQTLIQEPQEPLAAKILYDDSTAQALYRGLKNSLPFAGLVSSEGGSILKSRAFNDMAKLNALWSGDPITVDRIGSESVHLDNVRLTALIMVQPEVLDDFINKKGDQARGSGLMARFLFSSGESTQGTRFINPSDEPKWDSVDAFNQRIRQFLNASHQAVKAPSFKPEILELSPEAEKLWIEFSNNAEGKINAGEKYEQLGDHASKLPENVGRVAANIHKFENRHGKIAQDIMELAIEICKNASDNFINIFDIPSQEIIDAQLLIDWLYKKELDFPHGIIPKNYILQFCPARFRDTVGKVRLKIALDILYHDKDITYFKENGTSYVRIMK